MTIDKRSHHISSLCMNCACATWLIQGIKWSDTVDEWGTWAWKCREKENKQAMYTRMRRKPPVYPPRVLRNSYPSTGFPDFSPKTERMDVKDC